MNSNSDDLIQYTTLESLENSDNDINISTMTVNYQLLKLYIETVLSFDGNPHVSNVFLDSCQTLFTTINSNDPQLDTFLMRAIVGKLTGKVLSLLGSRSELRRWTEIREALILSLGDQRDIDC